MSEPVKGKSEPRKSVKGFAATIESVHEPVKQKNPLILARGPSSDPNVEVQITSEMLGLSGIHFESNDYRTSAPARRASAVGYLFGPMSRPSFEDRLFESEFAPNLLTISGSVGLLSRSDSNLKTPPPAHYGRTSKPASMSSGRSRENSPKSVSIQRMSPVTSKNIVETPVDLTSAAANLADKKLKIATQKKMSKEEKRAFQEMQRTEKVAQRAAAKGMESIKPLSKQSSTVSEKITLLTSNNVFALPPAKQSKKSAKIIKGTVTKQCTLLSHLPPFEKDSKVIQEAYANGLIHPAVISLGLHIMKHSITGGNALCTALLLAFKLVISDYSTPSGSTLQRDLTQHISRQVDFISRTRSLATSMKAAIRYLKTEISQISIDLPDSEAKLNLCDSIDEFLMVRITIAGKSIHEILLSSGKIKNNDSIMVFSRSSLVLELLLKACKTLVFSVIVVDSRPSFDGRGMLKELKAAGIKCTYILTNSIPYVIKQTTKVIIGTSSVMTNGDVMGKAGTAIVCMAAYDSQVPVIVLAETLKFSDQVRLDSFVWNELCEPDLLANQTNQTAQERLYTKSEVVGPLKNWENVDSLIVLNLEYDVTPAKLITMVACEHGMIPSNLVMSYSWK